MKQFCFNNLVIVKLIKYLLMGITLKEAKLSLCLISRPLHNENVLGSEDITPRILNIETRRMSVVSFTPRPLYPRERAPGTEWTRGLSRLQSCSGRCDGKKNILTLQGNELIHWPSSPRPTVVQYQLTLKQI